MLALTQAMSSRPSRHGCALGPPTGPGGHAWLVRPVPAPARDSTWLLQVTPPSWRPDLLEPGDLVEIEVTAGEVTTGRLRSPIVEAGYTLPPFGAMPRMTDEARDAAFGVNGQPGAMVVDSEGRVIYVFALDIVDDRVQAVRSVINPDKLQHLGPLSSPLTRHT